ncbi:hypothetical protein [Seinonella peptonophila]|uniref:hypothetical protein n=1 Tax=Seinonella peptonophila TaxID=112248 RepID=UPI000933A97C|nr:hypothetical protein [Seinonella peptonophila]
MELIKQCEVAKFMLLLIVRKAHTQPVDKFERREVDLLDYIVIFSSLVAFTSGILFSYEMGRETGHKIQKLLNVPPQLPDILGLLYSLMASGLIIGGLVGNLIGKIVFGLVIGTITGILIGLIVVRNKWGD